MTSIATAHVSFGFAALALGTVNALRAKGTPLHRLIGHGYYLSMLGLNGTAFGIYDFFGSFGLFHWFAVLSLCTTIGAIIPVALKRPRSWRYVHGYCMMYSYLGLLSATAAEIVVRIPPLWRMRSTAMYFLTISLTATAMVTVAGCMIIERTMRRRIAAETRREPVRQVNELVHL